MGGGGHDGVKDLKSDIINSGDECPDLIVAPLYDINNYHVYI